MHITLKDPVCGMQINKERAKEKEQYQGKDVFFCSHSCKKAFDQDPEKYVGHGPRNRPEPDSEEGD